MVTYLTYCRRAHRHQPQPSPLKYANPASVRQYRPVNIIAESIKSEPSVPWPPTSVLGKFYSKPVHIFLHRERAWIHEYRNNLPTSLTAHRDNRIIQILRIKTSRIIYYVCVCVCLTCHNKAKLTKFPYKWEAVEMRAAEQRGCTRPAHVRIWKITHQTRAKTRRNGNYCFECVSMFYSVAFMSIYRNCNGLERNACLIF